MPLTSPRLTHGSAMRWCSKASISRGRQTGPIWARHCGWPNAPWRWTIRRPTACSHWVAFNWREGNTLGRSMRSRPPSRSIHGMPFHIAVWGILSSPMTSRKRQFHASSARWRSVRRIRSAGPLCPIARSRTCSWATTRQPYTGRAARRWCRTRITGHAPSWCPGWHMPAISTTRGQTCRR